MSEDFTTRFLAFCRSKPADEAYPAYDASCCALAQFGFPGIDYFTAQQAGIPEEVYFEAAFSPSTFGALADRLEAVIQARGKL